MSAPGQGNVTVADLTPAADHRTHPLHMIAKVLALDLLPSQFAVRREEDGEEEDRLPYS